MSTTNVVILNWNGVSHLREFLPSVVETTPPGVGIVVADNGSDDDSTGVLEREFPSVRVIGLDRNYGFAQGYNLALRQLDADYFILLNSDVRTSPGWVEPLVAALDADPQLGAVAPKLRSYREPDRFEYAGAAGGFIDMFGYPFCRGRILSSVEKDTGQYETFRYTFWASGACMACRRELFTDTGGFDGEFFAHMEEIDLCWRAQMFGYRIAVEPASIVYHLGGGTLPNNSPAKIYLNYRNSLAMLYKNLPRRKFWIILPFRMVMDGMSATVFLIQGNTGFVREIWKAHRDFFAWRGTLRTKRASIQERATDKPVGVYFGSIVFRYFFRSKRFGKMKV